MTKTIPINKQPFADDIALILGDSIAGEWPARVGHPITKSVYVEGAGQTEVYLQPDGAAPQTVFVATNGLPGVDLFDGLSVYYKQLKTGKHLTRINETAQKSIYGNQPFNASPKIYIDDLYYATLQPTAPPSMQLWVTGFAYMDNGVYKYQKPLLTADFSSSPLDASSSAIDIPSTPNTAICVLVQYNKSTNTLSYKQSSSFPSRLSIENRPDLIPALDAGHIFCNAFLLPNGVTALTLDAHIFNAPALAWLYDSGAYTFAGLSDTTITSPSAGDIAYYNGAQWVNLPKGTVGQVLTQDTNAPAWDDAAGGGGGAGLTYLYRGNSYVSWESLVANYKQGDFEFTTVYNLTGFGVSTSVITLPAVSGYYMVGINMTLWNNASPGGYDIEGYVRIKIEGANTHDINLPTTVANQAESIAFTLPFLFAASDTFELSYSLSTPSPTLPDGGLELDMYLLNIIET